MSTSTYTKQRRDEAISVIRQEKEQLRQLELDRAKYIYRDGFNLRRKKPVAHDGRSIVLYDDFDMDASDEDYMPTKNVTRNKFEQSIPSYGTKSILTKPKTPRRLRKDLEYLPLSPFDAVCVLSLLPEGVTRFIEWWTDWSALIEDYLNDQEHTWFEKPARSHPTTGADFNTMSNAEIIQKLMLRRNENEAIGLEGVYQVDGFEDILFGRYGPSAKLHFSNLMEALHQESVAQSRAAPRFSGHVTEVDIDDGKDGQADRRTCMGSQSLASLLPPTSESQPHWSSEEYADMPVLATCEAPELSTFHIISELEPAHDGFARDREASSSHTNYEPELDLADSIMLQRVDAATLPFIEPRAELDLCATTLAPSFGGSPTHNDLLHCVDALNEPFNLDDNGDDDEYLFGNVGVPSTEPEFITTSFAHPMKFNDRTRPCQFCREYRFQIVGLGPPRVVSVASIKHSITRTAKEYIELANGYTLESDLERFAVSQRQTPPTINTSQNPYMSSSAHTTSVDDMRAATTTVENNTSAEVICNNQPTIMCASCTARRLMIAKCKFHIFTRIPNAISTIQRHQEKILPIYQRDLQRRDLSRFHGKKNTRPPPPITFICSLCPAPALWKCTSYQERDLHGRFARMPGVTDEDRLNELHVMFFDPQQSHHHNTDTDDGLDLVDPVLGCGLTLCDFCHDVVDRRLRGVMHLPAIRSAFTCAGRHSRADIDFLFEGSLLWNACST